MNVHILFMPETNWIMKIVEILMSGLATSIIVLSVTAIIDWRRALNRYKNYCALVVSELHNNFNKLVIYYNDPQQRGKPFNFEFSTWEKVNHEIVQFMPGRLFYLLSATYLFMKNSTLESCRTINDATISRLKSDIREMDESLRKICKHHDFDTLDEEAIIKDFETLSQ